MRRWCAIFAGLIVALTVLAAAQTQPAPFSPRQTVGTSGPGEPIAPESPVFARNARPDSKAVTNGLLPAIKPLLDLRIRHTAIVLGDDRNYYMTGTTGAEIWDHNDGIELWRSTDLRTWTYLGLVWSVERDGTWQKEWRTRGNRPVRTIWAPQLQFIAGNYFLSYSMFPGDRGILKSTTGKPEGPYVNALANDGKLSGDMYQSLFEDDDGAIYLVYAGGWVARMKDDMTGLAEEPRKPQLLDPDQNPLHHSPACAIRRDCMDIGHEGAFIFKKDDTYYLTAADTYDGRYSSMVAISDNIYGPYHSRHEAVPCGGGSTYFRDKFGRWWCTFWGNGQDLQAPWTEMPGIVRISFDEDGKIHPEH